MIIRKKPAVDSNIERHIIIGMITSDEFIVKIQQMYRPDLFRGKIGNIIAEWCQEYYDKYKSSPGKAIEDIFQSRRESGSVDEDDASLIEEFLTGLSREYEENTDVFNVQYYLDEAEKYFRLSGIDNLQSELAKCVVGKRIEDGENLIAEFERVSRQDAKGVDPFSHSSIVNSLNESSGDKLFKLHGAIGEAMGVFERGQLIALMGKPAIGKTWWLIHICLRALFSGHTVLFVSLEMSEAAIVKRILHWMTGLPNKKHAGQILIPVFDCVKNQTGQCNSGCGIDVIGPNKKDNPLHSRLPFNEAPTGYSVCTSCKGTSDFEPTSWYTPVNREELSIQSALKKKQKIEKLSAIKNQRLKVTQFPSGELSVSQFNVYLDNIAYYEGFVPDVIVTDYADKFKRSEREYRHGINEIWEGHKAIAQRRHCLVVTASQSTAARTKNDTGSGDWAEDIRKLNLIDQGFIINQTEWEHSNNIYRIKIPKIREDEFSLLNEIMVLNQLRIGRPYINSYKIIS